MLALVFAFPGIQDVSPMSAAAGVKIVWIHYNAPGDDDGSKESLNAERIRIRNDSSEEVSIHRWRIHDAKRDNVYIVPYRVSLAPGDYVTLMTGPGADGTGDCDDGDCPRAHGWHWDKRHHVWDNAGDTATVRRSDGILVDRCRYTREDRTPERCS